MKNLLSLRAPDLTALPRFDNALEALKNQVTALTAERDQARTDLTTAQASIKTLTGERDSARSEATTAQGQLKTANETIVARETTISAHEATISTLKSEATTVEKKAAQLLASQGHAPLALGADAAFAGTQKQGSLIEQYNALKTDAERSAFYAKHADKL